MAVVLEDICSFPVPLRSLPPADTCRRQRQRTSFMASFCLAEEVISEIDCNPGLTGR